MREWRDRQYEKGRRYMDPDEAFENDALRRKKWSNPELWPEDEDHEEADFAELPMESARATDRIRGIREEIIEESDEDHESSERRNPLSLDEEEEKEDKMRFKSP